VIQLNKNDENLCNDGRCKRVRMGEKRHPKHLKEKENIPEDKDAPFRNPNFVSLLFYILLAVAGFLTYTSTITDVTILKIVSSTLSVAFIGVAIQVLAKGDSVKTRDRIARIEEKLDKILENRDNVLQNK